MYVGEYCQYSNPCKAGNEPRCQHGGKCEVVITQQSNVKFKCKCPLGYSASLCEIPEPNSCDDRPCVNGGTCVLKSLKEYSCICAPGYTGNFTHIKIGTSNTLINYYL